MAKSSTGLWLPCQSGGVKELWPTAMSRAGKNALWHICFCAVLCVRNMGYLSSHRL